MTQIRPSGFQLLPPVVKNLLIINGLFFLATISLETAFHIDLTKILGLHFVAATDFKPYQFITYMFMHGGFTHILFNMFALWMFGNTLENIWGGKRFLIFYMITGIGAGITYTVWIYFQMRPDLQSMDAFLLSRNLDELSALIGTHEFMINKFSGQIWVEFQSFQQTIRQINLDPENHEALHAAVNFITHYKEYYLNRSIVVGASGAVYGILLAFGMMFPNALIYLYFAIPIRAKYFVLIFGAFELFEGIRNSPGNNIAHFAHLGGMIFGFFLIRYWKKKGELH
ncbi:MAG: rhomboid family intramembrane serine protease [Bacteroidales bacterium]|jgi:membrane associated rhomboid family serine protease|nr:rhomboid family intramembrane serine protease [Bacteroidales bacterium]MCK9448460.1 rhomboid family intramembrane serine protease [Bacteroidales bacterium]MDD3701622.1 rhomboid family intramembrane serine protease [Bacteroidales bacterium]MDY0369789.1 rhomboid family intramembrane serine protease [Bacteroidales bacterium]